MAWPLRRGLIANAAALAPAAVAPFDDGLARNGAFDDTSEWTLATAGGSSTATISGGTLNLTGDAINEARADQQLDATTNGVQYRLTCTFANASCGIMVGTTQGGFSLLNTAAGAGAVDVTFTASGTTTWLRFARSSGGTCSIDNVKVAPV